MRINYGQVAPGAIKALNGLYAYHEREGEIEPKLRYLVELRVSQINGCAFCVDKHSEEAREVGETQQRLDCLPVWREVSFFDDRERAALEWAEAVTLIAQSHVPDDVYEQARPHFNEKELVDLTLIVAAMNAWNRLAISFRKAPAPRQV
ncbi:MAG: carboxymuconolactone decarboxylase family protein [Armatimonadota bacterium]|nr:carboxymuconolactone decarboxylase family protein [Armatimonadota bacterium]